MSPPLDSILDAAYVCLRRSGVRRTTMEDIAQELGTSRTVLYRDVRSTNDAFRKLAARFLDRALTSSRQALEADTALTQRVVEALSVKLHLVDHVRTNAPDHAAEFLGEHAKISADLTATYLADLHDMLTAALDDIAGTRAREVASILIALTRSLEDDPDRRHATSMLSTGVELIIAGLTTLNEKEAP